MYVSAKSEGILHMGRYILPLFEVSRINISIYFNINRPTRKIQNILVGVREAAGSRKFSGARLAMVCMSL